MIARKARRGEEARKDDADECDDVRRLLPHRFSPLLVLCTECLHLAAYIRNGFVVRSYAVPQCPISHAHPMQFRLENIVKLP
ncbi:MAG: hypothetical protein WC698_03570 [Candidatus Peribacteraceae bacterium]